MNSIFRLGWKERPVTAALLVAALGLFAAVILLQATEGCEFQEAVMQCGGATKFEIWNGAWWRIFISLLHHGGALHLAMNGTALWFLGGMLERRLRSLRYILLILGSAAVSGVAQALVDSPAIGLSGVAFAVFGALTVFRDTDEALAEQFNDQVLTLGMFWLFLCIPLTYFEILHIANVAHFTGILYGWIAAKVIVGTRWFPGLSRAGFLVAHALVLPACYYAMHPFWDGTYHWRMADLAAKAGDEAADLQQSELAIACNPQLHGPWLHIAAINERRGRILVAWEYLLRGIRHNPGFTAMIGMAKEMWKSLQDPADQEAARLKLREVFGTDSPAWERTLAGVPPLDPDPSQLLKPTVLEAGPGLFGPIRLPMHALDEGPQPQGKLAAPDPEIPGSAEEGRST